MWAGEHSQRKLSINVSNSLRFCLQIPVLLLIKMPWTTVRQDVRLRLKYTFNHSVALSERNSEVVFERFLGNWNIKQSTWMECVERQISQYWWRRPALYNYLYRLVCELETVLSGVCARLCGHCSPHRATDQIIYSSYLVATLGWWLNEFE